MHNRLLSLLFSSQNKRNRSVGSVRDKRLNTLLSLWSSEMALFKKSNSWSTCCILIFPGTNTHWHSKIISIILASSMFESPQGLLFLSFTWKEQWVIDVWLYSFPRTNEYIGSPSYTLIRWASFLLGAPQSIPFGSFREKNTTEDGNLSFNWRKQNAPCLWNTQQH